MTRWETVFEWLKSVLLVMVFLTFAFWSWNESFAHWIERRGWTWVMWGALALFWLLYLRGLLEEWRKRSRGEDYDAEFLIRAGIRGGFLLLGLVLGLMVLMGG